MKCVSPHHNIQWFVESRPFIFAFLDIHLPPRFRSTKASPSHQRSTRSLILHEMATHSQYKPTRTQGVGFIPPTLKRQHQIRLPFIKNPGADRDAQIARHSGELGAVATRAEGRIPVEEGPEVESQSQKKEGQGTPGADGFVPVSTSHQHPPTTDDRQWDTKAKPITG